MYLRRKPLASGIVAALVIATLVRAVWEIGFAFGPWCRACAGSCHRPGGRLAASVAGGAQAHGQSRGFAALLAVVLVAGFAAMFKPHGCAGRHRAAAAGCDRGGERRQRQLGALRLWPKGTRFAPYTQIDKQNVDKLQVAWTYRSGELAEGASESQNTPLQIGDTIYTCTPTSKVIALDADTGKDAGPSTRSRPISRRGTVAAVSAI